VLQRGYAVVYDRSGQVAHSVRQIQSGDDLTIRLKDGRVDAHARQIHLNPPEGGATDER